MALQLTILDYFGPIAALIVFALAMFLFSFFVVNFFYITKTDDLTLFEKFGAQFNIALGRHSLADIYRGGPAPPSAATDTELAETSKNGGRNGGRNARVHPVAKEKY